MSPGFARAAAQVFSKVRLKTSGRCLYSRTAGNDGWSRRLVSWHPPDSASARAIAILAVFPSLRHGGRWLLICSFDSASNRAGAQAVDDRSSQHSIHATSVRPLRMGADERPQFTLFARAKARRTGQRASVSARSEISARIPGRSSGRTFAAERFDKSNASRPDSLQSVEILRSGRDRGHSAES